MDEHEIAYEDSDKKFKSTPRSKMNYWWYFNVKRRSGKIGRWFIWKLPKRVVYWCVVRAAVEVEPNYSPTNVTVEEMLKKFDYS